MTALVQCLAPRPGKGFLPSVRQRCAPEGSHGGGIQGVEGAGGRERERERERKMSVQIGRVSVQMYRKFTTSYTSRLLAGGMHVSKGTSSNHGSFGFDSLDNIRPDESKEPLDQSFEPERRKEGLPEQDPAEMAVEVSARIR